MFHLVWICQADIDINMEVPSQLRHIIRAGRMEDKGQPDSIQKSPITCSAIRIRGSLGLLARICSAPFFLLAQRRDVFNEIVSCATSTNTPEATVSSTDLHLRACNLQLEIGGSRILIVTIVQRKKET